MIATPKPVVVWLLLSWLTLASPAVFQSARSEDGTELDVPEVSVELALEPKPHFVLRSPRLSDDVQPEKAFRVVALIPELENPPALLGRFARSGMDRLSFFPRYPLSDGLEYRLELGEMFPEGSLPPEQRTFRLPARSDRPVTQVAQIFPSADRLPENVLRFYLHFSSPMSRGRAYEHIQLLHDGQPIEAPFLELGEELWNPDQTRFTLFVHPGRIKRGLKPREESGPPMQRGEEYSLRISRHWQDAEGRPLTEDFVKRFRIVAPDQQQLNPENWRIETPPSDSRQPVALRFDEPLDSALLLRLLEVKRRDASRVAGTIELKEEETVWTFTPTEDWAVGTYYIEVATHLEDLCGNSIARPFEVSPSNQSTDNQPRPRIAIEFIVK